MYTKQELENTIHNINCIELMKQIPDNTIDLILTDPPYKVISGGKPKSKGQPSGILSKNDGKIFNHNSINIKEYIHELYRILKPGYHCYIMVNNLNLEEFLRETRLAGFGFHNLLIWDKGNKVTARRYMKTFENILFLRKGRAKPINNKGDGQILKYPNPRDKIHHTEKPSDLRIQMIENSSEPGDLVYDPFAGAGGVGEASIQTGRKYLLSELSVNFYNIQKMRLVDKKSRKEIKSVLNEDMYIVNDNGEILYPDK